MFLDIKNFLSLAILFATVCGCSFRSVEDLKTEMNTIKITAEIVEVLTDFPIVYQRSPLEQRSADASAVQTAAILSISEPSYLRGEKQIRIFFMREWPAAELLGKAGVTVEFVISQRNLELALCADCRLIAEPYVFSGSLLDLRLVQDK